ncbi:MAG: 6-phosphogluconolactonase [Bryobacterales bacterium]|nr:6-phosphogluconolactonase [Bryobacterales bacterium]
MSGQQELMRVSVEELRARARTPFRLLPDTKTLLRHFARSIADGIQSRNERGEPSRLILPVGPTKHYPLLAEITNRERISWRDVHVFQMDEFLDWQGRLVPESHPLSFVGFMRRELFEQIDPALRMPQRQYCFPHPFRPDEISERIEKVGGIDCCYGGIGYHGHVAFNEPPLTRWGGISVDALRNSLTRVVPLAPDSIIVQSIHCSGGDSSAIPPLAVTLGMKDILGSRRIRLYLAAGERHRAVFRIAVAGDVMTDYPATLVQGHCDAEILTDEATARPIELELA